jgi:lysophospholipase L1-like esterase
VSDPVPVDLPSGGNLSICIFVPARTEAASFHYSASQTVTIEPGDTTLSSTPVPSALTLHSWVFLAGVDVEAEASAGAIVAFGDSITDGTKSTDNANHRWPDVLAAVLRSSPATGRTAVVNAGISGNRLLHDSYGTLSSGISALARFDRDVLVQPGARSVVILEGINDLGHYGSNAPLSEAVTAADVEGALSELAARAHESGLRVYLCTLLPFEGTVYPGYYTPAKNEAREQINAWIRSNQVADGVVDFDLLTRDPAQRRRILPAYDCGDHLHPNDTGYRAMGTAVAEAITGHGSAR